MDRVTNGPRPSGRRSRTWRNALEPYLNFATPRKIQFFVHGTHKCPWGECPKIEPKIFCAEFLALKRQKFLF